MDPHSPGDTVGNIALPLEPGNVRLTVVFLCIYLTFIIDFFDIPNSFSNHFGMHSISSSKSSNSTSCKLTSMPPIKDCKVILEDISSCKAAVKPNALKHCQEKTHTTSSRNSTDVSILQDLESKRPIAWPRMNGERWAILDGAVFSKLHHSNTLFDRIQLLEETIYLEAAKLFGHSQINPSKNLAGKSRRTKLCISLVKEKNALLSKLSLTANPQEVLMLKDLLGPIRQKIKSLRRGEKQRKKRWLFKKAQTSFKLNPYRAGKELLDPKSNVFLTIDQELLDLHKAKNV